MQLQEVSRTHSTLRSKKRGKGKGPIQSVPKLHPQYVVGFIDGEGSFSVSIYRDETMRNKIYVRPEFEIELRADDLKILQRIQRTLGCGKIYDCKYERYGWYPHVKYKVSRFNELVEILFPFFEKWPLQGKKAKTFKYFRKIVEKRMRGEHLTERGVREITALREKIRALGKKHRLETAKIRENRSSGGVGK